ncbi:uncharacterized protein LOC124166983 [Ischnura elegans]|uniref:uncharacterized protein LOC124166983 n=1 Tax=Ischnura elegans TaxID=197161 RepID=UPI001ED8BC7A|nr:uncharacterized protein LOC124166983 [Ischnura elegans]
MNCSPCESSWPTYEVRIFPHSSCDTYEQAREMETMAVDTSDLDANKPLGRGLRRKRARVLFDGETSDEDDSVRRIPFPPKLQKSHCTVTEDASIQKRQLLESQPLSDNGCNPDTMLAETSFIMETVINADSSCKCGNLCCQQKTAKIDQIALSNELLKKKLDSMQMQLSEALENTRLLVTSIDSMKSTSQGPGLRAAVQKFNLPMNTIGELRELEDAVKDASSRELLREELKMQGGNTLVAAVNAMCYHLMTDELAREFTYLGVPGRNKPGFKDLEIDRILFDALQSRVMFSSAMKKDVAKAVGEWLRQANGRFKRRRILTNSVNDIAEAE